MLQDAIRCIEMRSRVPGLAGQFSGRKVKISKLYFIFNEWMKEELIK